MLRFQTTLAGAVLALALAPTAADAAYIYSPGPAFETQEGNVNNVVFKHTDSRTQWVFKSAIFGATPITINAMAFRFDEIVSNRDIRAGNYTFGDTFNLRLGTLAGVASPTFADNLQNAREVLSGAQVMPFAIGGPAGTTKPFGGVTFNFTSPFIYDPAQGDLLVDVFVPGQGLFGTFDFVQNNPLAYRVFNRELAPTGSIQAFAPVVRFEVSAVVPGNPGAVPEPATWLMMVLGFGSLGLALRRREQRLRRVGYPLLARNLVE